MTRSVDNFLTKEEQNMIIRFIESSKKRPQTHNHKTQGLPPELDTKPLKLLWEMKNDEWSSFLHTLTEDQRTNFENLWKEGRSKCAIEEFLATLKNIIDGKTQAYHHLNILDDFKTRINDCNKANLPYSCPVS